MSAALLASWTRRARVRSALDDALGFVPAVAAAAIAAGRWAGPLSAAGLAVGGAVVVGAAALARARRLDRPWLVRRLDQGRPELEDSTDLLAADRAALPPLQRLQRDRVQARLAGDGPDPRPAWSTRRLWTAWAAGLAASAAVLAWPRAGGLAPAADGPPPPAGAPRLVASRLHVVPPAYTGLAPRDLPGLDAQVPQGSRLEWTLRFSPRPEGAELAVTEGSPPPLRRAGDDWTAGLTLDRSLLYRIAVRGGPAAAAPPLHRLEAIADTPPQVRVLQPVRTLTEVSGGRRSWALLFEAEDDYGAAPDAVLRLTVAQGEGEQVGFSERRLTLHGSGPPRRRRYAASLDLAALGFKPGGDLVAQLLVSDLRAPSPQTTASPSLILRWPSAPETAAEGLDGAVKKVLPAYLRSERQIIIDAERLIRERGGLSPARFQARSDGLGADQQGLRLRYGQFLGGENEQAENALPTSDADEAPARAPAASADAPVPAKPFGAEGDVTRTYGHAHDETESSALEPSTRAKLKLSVDQMWAAETHLRQGDPAGALPYANKALAFLKEAQQAERVFVPHTGLAPPPIDETRRLTGKRDGLDRNALELAPAGAVDPAPFAAWRALADAPGPASAADPAAALAMLERWLSTDAARGADRLAVAAAIDAVRREPRCERCRRGLRGLVWTLLQRPPAHVARRPELDAAGRRYLDALGGAASR